MVIRTWRKGRAGSFGDLPAAGGGGQDRDDPHLLLQRAGLFRGMPGVQPQQQPPTVEVVPGQLPASTLTSAARLVLGGPDAPYSRLLRAPKSARRPPLHGYVHGPMHGGHITRRRRRLDIWFTACKMPPTDGQMRHGHAMDAPAHPLAALTHRGSRTNEKRRRVAWPVGLDDRLGCAHRDLPPWLNLTLAYLRRENGLRNRHMTRCQHRNHGRERRSGHSACPSTNPSAAPASRPLVSPHTWFALGSLLASAGGAFEGGLR
jgi:hypothetical protein